MKIGTSGVSAWPPLVRVRGEPVGIHAFGLKLPDAFRRDVVEEARG